MIPNTFHLVSLGCAKNTVDSTTIGNLLNKRGYSFEEDPKKAEILIVNTCGFIRPAREEAIETINELARKKSKKQYLIAAGCMAIGTHGEYKRSFGDIRRSFACDSLGFAGGSISADELARSYVIRNTGGSF